MICYAVIVTRTSSLLECCKERSNVGLVPKKKKKAKIDKLQMTGRKGYCYFFKMYFVCEKASEGTL